MLISRLSCLSFSSSSGKRRNFLAEVISLRICSSFCLVSCIVSEKSEIRSEKWVVFCCRKTVDSSLAPLLRYGACFAFNISLSLPGNQMLLAATSELSPLSFNPPSCC